MTQFAIVHDVSDCVGEILRLSSCDFQIPYIHQAASDQVGQSKTVKFLIIYSASELISYHRSVTLSSSILMLRQKYSAEAYILLMQELTLKSVANICLPVGSHEVVRLNLIFANHLVCKFVILE